MPDIPTYLLKLIQLATGGAHRKGRRPDKRRSGLTRPPLEQRKAERRKVNHAAKAARKLNRKPKRRRR